MIQRTLQRTLESYLGKGKAILLVGARQVGKSTLFRMLTRKVTESDLLWLNCDQQSVKELLENASLTNTVSSNIFLYKDACISVDSGGVLIVDNGKIEQADIQLKPGSSMIIRNNGKVILDSADNFVSEIGSTLNIFSGEIEIKQ